MYSSRAMTLLVLRDSGPQQLDQGKERAKPKGSPLAWKKFQSASESSVFALLVHAAISQ